MPSSGQMNQPFTSQFHKGQNNQGMTMESPDLNEEELPLLEGKPLYKILNLFSI